MYQHPERDVPTMLTDTACKNAKSTQKPYKLTDGEGLYLQVTPSGRKYWRLNYRYAGRQKTLAIGVYPIIGLGKARELRLEAKRSLASGIDPSAEKQIQKQKLKDKVACTFERVAREWHSVNVGKWKENHGNDILHRLERDIFPEIGSAPIADLRPRQILDAIQLIEKRGAFETARRTLQYCGQVFRYGGILEYCKHNPTECLRGALRPFSKEHHAAIESEEIPELLSAMNSNHARL
jgi:hypothetical protein